LTCTDYLNCVSCEDPLATTPLCMINQEYPIPFTPCQGFTKPLINKDYRVCFDCYTLPNCINCDLITNLIGDDVT
jgi:hypothetical protein